MTVIVRDLSYRAIHHEYPIVSLLIERWNDEVLQFAIEVLRFQASPLLLLSGQEKSLRRKYALVLLMMILVACAGGHMDNGAMARLPCSNDADLQPHE